MWPTVSSLGANFAAARHTTATGIKPDYLKSGVNKASFYDPEINRTYSAMAANYAVREAGSCSTSKDRRTSPFYGPSRASSITPPLPFSTSVRTLRGEPAQGGRNSLLRIAGG